MPKEKKMKIYFNKEMEDLPFPELQNYKLLVEKPSGLKDINETEAVKLVGIETGADVTADSTFVTVTYPDDMAGIQTQIDGKIVSWFTDSDPEDTWEGTDASHEGDMWWNTSTKKLKRYSGSSWSAEIEDQKAIDAYSNAATAQDTADGKRRVFTAEPTTPYDVGDLWSEGPSGDLKKCKTANASGDYDAGHWELASKYTEGADESNLSEGALARLFTDDTARANVEAWRKSGALTEIDGQKIYTQSIYAEDIKAGTMTGFTIQTAASGQRIVLTSNTFSSYDASALRIRLEGDLIKFYDDNGNLRCQLEGVDVGQEGINGIKIDANPGGAGYKFYLSSAGFVFTGGTFEGDVLVADGQVLKVGGTFGSPETSIYGDDYDSVIGKGLRITGHCIPVGAARDLGDGSNKWRDIHLSGTAFIAGKLQIPVGTNLY